MKEALKRAAGMAQRKREEVEYRETNPDWRRAGGRAWSLKLLRSFEEENDAHLECVQCGSC